MIAVVDPELMLSVPRKFTAYQGFDELFRNMGGFICNRESPFGQMVQLEAMRNIGAWLPVAVRDGSSLEALGELQVACGVDGMRMSDYGFAGTRGGAEVTVPALS